MKNLLIVSGDDWTEELIRKQLFRFLQADNWAITIISEDAFLKEALSYAFMLDVILAPFALKGCQQEEWSDFFLRAKLELEVSGNFIPIILRAISKDWTKEHARLINSGVFAVIEAPVDLVYLLATINSACRIKFAMRELIKRADFLCD